MSTSLLYHAFGTRGYRYVRTASTEGQVIFTLRQEPGTCRRSACGSADVIARGHAQRRFRSLPIGSRATSLVLPVPRVECRAVGWCAGSRSPSPTRGGATPGLSSGTCWGCPGG